MDTVAFVEAEALRRYVRARAADCSAAERRGLDEWLAADSRHRDAYERLELTWRALDALADHACLRRRRYLPVFSFGWRAGLAAGLACALATLLVVFGGLRWGSQHYETVAGEHRRLVLADGSEVVLNANSAIDVVPGETQRIDLLRGDIYIAVSPAATGRLEVRAAGARIRDIGTRFAAALTARGGSVAVEAGEVEVEAGSARARLGVGRGADFAADHIEARPVAAVAPWRDGHWRFQATPLTELATELARQQSILLDLPDAAVGNLTISGSFDIAAPESVLWAVSQVHGLRLTQLSERHYALLR